MLIPFKSLQPLVFLGHLLSPLGSFHFPEVNFQLQNRFERYNWFIHVECESHLFIECLCLQALKDGDELMNLGKLKDALPYYEKVMDKLMFQVIFCC